MASIIDLHADKTMPEPNSGCWIWTGSTDRGGYGKVRHLGRTWSAHRLAFLIAEGYLPPRPSYHHPRHGEVLVLDHLCRNRLCVNSEHLAVVTRAENIRRGTSANREKTHCPQGHPYSGKNLYVCSRGFRQCRTCNRARKTPEAAPDVS